MLTEYVHRQARAVDDELRELAPSRPRYDRPHERRSRLRSLLRRVAFAPTKAGARDGVLPRS